MYDVEVILVVTENHKKNLRLYIWYIMWLLQANPMAQDIYFILLHLKKNFIYTCVQRNLKSHISKSKL